MRARASHLDALLDDERVLAVAGRVEFHHDAGEGRGRGAGRRILPDAPAEAEHARAICGALARLVGIEIEAGAAAFAPERAVRVRLGERDGAAQRREDEIDAGAEDGRMVRAEADVLRLEPELAGEFGRARALRRPAAAGAAG